MAQLQIPRHAATDEEAGELYRLIAETVPLMVWTSDAEGNVDYVNQRTTGYAGLPAHALEGWDWKRIVHPDDWDACLVTWSRSLRSGEPCENEMRLRRADGAYRWHHASGVPLRDGEGRVIRWFGICTDIEDQLRSAQVLESLVERRTRELRQTQGRLGAIIENEPECVKLLDARGCLLEMNAAGLRMIEADAIAPLLGTCIYPLIAAQHRDAFRDLTERVCSGERATLVFEMVGLKGTRRWLETHAAPFREEASGETRLLAITRDITDRKRLEEVLRGSERKYRALVELSRDAIIVGQGGVLVYVNQAALRLLGAQEASQVLGRPVNEIVHPEDAAVVAARRERLERGEGPLPPGQVRLRRLDGSYVMTEGTGALVDYEGRPAVMTVARDITQRIEGESRARRQAEDIRQLLNRLIAAQETERRRVADDLHDLIGQNLTALGIALKALKQRLGAAGDLLAAPALDTMGDVVETTIDSIRGLMTDLRPAALEEFGLVPALRWHAALFAKRTGMEVSVHGSELRLPAEIELALFRIAQEALTNAAKHSGGSLVDVGIERTESAVRLNVSDDGRGFVESEGARTAARGGWGLPAMRERAEALGGSLAVRFPERGTRIVVEIPLKNDD